MKEESEKWVRAGIVLGKDPNAEVRCPECNSAILEVEDIPLGDDSSKVERYLSCPACKACNVLRMARQERRGNP